MLEPKDKLDAVMVNGPGDVPRTDLESIEWDWVDWQGRERDVRRLRQRIFKASKGGDLAKVRNLQKLMLRSRSNTLVSVRQITQRNAGRGTPGVDGEVALTSDARAKVAVRVHASIGIWRPRTVRRVYIPKAGSRTKLRPLGIPVIMDRCHQARVRNALEPEWEARFEPKSYGFRPGRSCQDALTSIHTTSNGPRATRLWTLDADLAAAFDKIDHEHLLATIGSFPARDMTADWLRAGIFEAGKGFAPTEEGTPQGGVISPLLLNIALHGMEEAAGVRYDPAPSQAGRVKAGSPVLVRYADDIAVLCRSQQQAQQVKARLAEWLAPRGLVFNEDKTQIVHLDGGFDFLGCTIRRHHGKLLITPSKAAVGRLRERLSAEVRALRGSNAKAVTARLNPIIKGWSAYYRSVCSTRTFNALDDHMWRLLYKWSKWTHPNKPKRWIIERHFGRRNKFRNDHWVFGDPDNTAHVTKFSWTGIVRHPMVKAGASPDDPDLANYWTARRRKVKPPLDNYTLRLLAKQNGHCPTCGQHLLTTDQPPQSPHQWERWWLQVTHRAITSDYLALTGKPGPTGDTTTCLIHTHCARGHHARYRNTPAQHT